LDKVIYSLIGNILKDCLLQRKCLIFSTLSIFLVFFTICATKAEGVLPEIGPRHWSCMVEGRENKTMSNENYMDHICSIRNKIESTALIVWAFRFGNRHVGSSKIYCEEGWRMSVGKNCWQLQKFGGTGGFVHESRKLIKC
jgi:hypothetical protein